MTAPLSNDEFFAELAKLFEANRIKGHGAIYLTQKRLTYNEPSAFPDTPSTTPFSDLEPTKPLRVLIRATNGKSKASKAKSKVSTIVEADALEGFFTRYAEACKGGMSGLKKRDRSKAKAKQRAKKKAGAGEEKKA